MFIATLYFDFSSHFYIHIYQKTDYELNFKHSVDIFIRDNDIFNNEFTYEHCDHVVVIKFIQAMFKMLICCDSSYVKHLQRFISFLKTFDGTMIQPTQNKKNFTRDAPRYVHTHTRAREPHSAYGDNPDHPQDQ